MVEKNNIPMNYDLTWYEEAEADSQPTRQQLSDQIKRVMGLVDYEAVGLRLAAKDSDMQKVERQLRIINGLAAELRRLHEAYQSV